MVHFMTTDGVVLTGSLSMPSQKENLTFILLHGLGSGKGEWDTFAAQLIADGYGVLSYDARGHGESTKTSKGAKVSYTEFGASGPGSPWSRMVDDLGQAVKFLKRQGITEKRVALCGASLGANVSMLYAAGHPALPMTILLSPGSTYAGLDISSAVTEYGGRPMAVAASYNDRYAYLSSQAIIRALKGNHKVVFIEGPGGHGVQMFNGTFDKQLREWINKNDSHHSL